MLEQSTGTSRRLEETGSFPMSTRRRILVAEGGGEGEDDIDPENRGVVLDEAKLFAPRPAACLAHIGGARWARAQVEQKKRFPSRPKKNGTRKTLSGGKAS